ncbi:MAG: c-type cytochrome [Candidatus Rokubacteria bacterium]|nr:c-type cytochrome [Candidatus Rokubacteria bacterium]
MTRPFLSVVIFTLFVIVAIVGIGELVTRVSGEGGRRPAVALISADITVEAGEAIFWGRGKCSICHAVASRGAAIRGPDQGASGPLGLPIGARAAERAKERAEATGKTFTPTDYLVESVTDPGAYVVKGFKNEMPDPTRPPISLKPNDLRAVILYLQSLGGRPDLAAIRLPERLLAIANGAAPATEEWSPYILGDAKKGEALFFGADSNAACGKCHAVRDRGGKVGPPDLTQVAGTWGPKFIVESILDPSKQIASGYESVLIVTREGRYVSGIVKKEDASIIEVVDNRAKIQRISKAQIQRRSPQKTSLMPGNFGEILTVEEFHDLLAYVLTLR